MRLICDTTLQYDQSVAAVLAGWIHDQSFRRSSVFSLHYAMTPGGRSNGPGWSRRITLDPYLRSADATLLRSPSGGTLQQVSEAVAGAKRREARARYAQPLQIGEALPDWDVAAQGGEG